MQPTSLNAVLIDSANGERLVKFYRDVLGVPLKDERHGSDLHWGCFIGGLHFAIHHVPGLATKSPAVAISFSVDDVTASAKELEGKGLKLEMQPTRQPFGTLAGVRDPDGNLVYLHAYPSER